MFARVPLNSEWNVTSSHAPQQILDQAGKSIRWLATSSGRVLSSPLLDLSVAQLEATVRYFCIPQVRPPRDGQKGPLSIREAEDVSSSASGRCCGHTLSVTS